MKTLILLSLAIFIGCGSDSPVTNSPVPPSSSDTVLLFSRDSIYTGSPYQGRDSVEFTSSVSIDTLHVQFTYRSNNVLGCYVRSYTFDTSYTQLPLTFSKDYHLVFPINNSFTCETYLELMGATGSSYYASLRNIRLWYVN